MFYSRVEDEMESMKEKAIRFFSVEKQLPVKAPHLFGKHGAFNFRRVSSGGTGGSKVFHEDHEPWKKGILDPGSVLMLKWNRIFLGACLVALFVDPFYFYLPKVENAGKNSMCVKLSPNLSTILTVFRTFADMFYILHIVIKFRTAYTAPSSRVFGRGEFVMDRRKIAKRYLQTDFFIDLFAALPLPQIVILIIIPAIKRKSNADHSNNTLALIVLLQYFPRLYLIFPLMSQIINTTGVVMKTAWAGAGYNLCLYMLASHVLGASWYLLSIDRQSFCWKSNCETLGDKCHKRFFDCDHVNDLDRIAWEKNTSAFSVCNATDGSIAFKYGIFGNALTKDAVSADFVKKYFYCLWWGLQQLSSYGQNLSTSTYIGETSFAILIAVVGLVLFAHLIGNMQSYLQSITIRLEEWRLKRRDTEEWMQHRQLPHELRGRVRKFVQYKWFATRGVDEDAILRSLPSDLRRDIQRHLCFDLVRRVPFFAQMDEPLLDAICERLISCLSTEGTFIVCEGDPVTEMLFIIRGRLESSTTNGGRTGFFNSTILGPGDFCGEELLAWALHPKNTINLPSSTQTVKALVEVEAFLLRAEDLKFVANQFRRLHSKRFQHTFRFYSHQYRTRAACFIQAAWRRFKRRKIVKDLSTQVSFASKCDDQEEHGGSKDSSTEQNVNIAILASKLSASTLRKPDEPDFSSDMF